MDFHSKTRYNIRLADRKGVKIKEDCTKKDLEDFYQILLVTSERDEFLVRNYSYYEQLWDKLVERGLAKLFMAEYNGMPIAGTIAFIFGSKAWYIYGASSNEYRNVMPNYALQWRMIEWAKQNGCTMYDFRGVSGDLIPTIRSTGYTGSRKDSTANSPNSLANMTFPSPKYCICFGIKECRFIETSEGT